MTVERMMEYNFPFTMRDVLPNLYEHWISLDLLTYIRLAMGSRSRSDFLQIMNRPNRYISRDALIDPVVSLDKLRQNYQDRASRDNWQCRTRG